jgi:hypothetical protein
MYDELPVALRAQPADPQITVFLLAPLAPKKVGHYFGIDAGGDTPAYEDSVQVAVVNWPEGKVVAVRKIGAEPPQVITHRNGNPDHSTHGDYTRRAMHWILSMQAPSLEPADPARGKTSGLPASAIAPHRWTQAEAEAEAARRFPQLGIANSPMNKAYLARLKQLKVETPDFFLTPDWPLRLAADVGH